MSFSDTRKWNAFWIGSGETLHDWRGEVLPAPYFRQEFDFRGGKECRLYLCGLGYHELRLNGKKVGDCELAPAPTNYDAHAGYLVYDVFGLLKPGRNAVGVVLGNGLYNCHTAEAWHFDKATWRDYPKLLLELVVDGETILSRRLLAGELLGAGDIRRTSQRGALRRPAGVPRLGCPRL